MRRHVTLPALPTDRRASCKLKSWDQLISRMYRYGIKSGSELARKAGLQPGAVNHLVFRRRDTCSPDTARAIEEALGLLPDDLFTTIEYQVSGYGRLAA